MKPLVPNITLLVLSLAFISIISACKKQEFISPYKVMDSGMWIADGSNEKVWWIDNERILFPTNEKMQPFGGASTNVIWNISTGQFSSIHVAEVYCVQNGIIFYGVLDRAARKYNQFRGPLENPIEYPKPSTEMRVDSCFDCDWVPQFSRKKTPYQIKLKEDNYLEVNKHESLTKDKTISHGETKYYEKLGLTPKPLPVYVDITRPYSLLSGNSNLSEPYIINFNHLRDSYFISPSAYSPQDTYYHSMFWLQRDGNISQVSLPKNLPWSSNGRLHIYPLRDGYLALYNGKGKQSITDSGERGLYLIKGENIEKVLPGEISGVSVSPDGCRAAFSHARNTKELLSRKKPYKTIKYISFCEGK